MRTGAMPLIDMEGMPCPIARSRAGATNFSCIGVNCPLLREMPMTCNSAWLDAVKAKAVEIGDKTAAKTEAARKVAADPEGHGLTRLFYCGLGGRPE